MWFHQGAIFNLWLKIKKGYNMSIMKPIHVLLVDDDEADIELTKQALLTNKIKIDLDICFDGIEAMQYLRQEAPFENATRPDIVLLDLNMPRKDGRETLQDIRADENLKSLPVVILTTSEADTDIFKSYKLGCSCYVSKPVGMDEFSKVLQILKDCWFTVVKLPNKDWSL